MTTESGTNLRTVVLAVDASEHSERAFDWYIKNICDKERDKVVFIHAQEYPRFPAAAGPYGDSSAVCYDVWRKQLEKSDKDVKELFDTFGTKCKLHGLKSVNLYKEESNRPGEVICKLAGDEKAQLIVIGSRGVGTLRRTFLGSVSDYCVHHAHIPVVVIPPGDLAHSS